MNTISKSKRGTYDPKYEKTRKQRPISFSVGDVIQARLLDFITKFQYGTYFKNVLAQLNDDEQKRIIDGDLETLPISLFKQNINASKAKISDFYTVVDATRAFDHDDIVKHLTDDALLKELANRNLASTNEPLAPNSAVTPFSVVGATHLSGQQFASKQVPVVNEFGCIEVHDDDGSVRFIEAEHYAEYMAQ